MPLFGTPQPGSNPISGLNLTDLRPGDNLTLLDGTETVVTGSASVAFARGNGQAGTDAGSSFFISGCPNGSTINIQGSAGIPYSDPPAPNTLANFDASFQTLPGATVVGNGAYTDIGRALFYRIQIGTLVGGDAPVVVVSR